MAQERLHLVEAATKGRELSLFSVLDVPVLENTKETFENESFILLFLMLHLLLRRFSTQCLDCYRETCRDLCIMLENSFLYNHNLLGIVHIVCVYLDDIFQYLVDDPRKQLRISNKTDLCYQYKYNRSHFV